MYGFDLRFFDLVSFGYLYVESFLGLVPIKF